MRYFANPSTPSVRKAMSSGLIACIVTPKQGNRIPDGVPFCLDNGRFGKGWPGHEKWWAKVEAIAADDDKRRRCEFVVAPDVVADAEATLAESAEWLPRIRALGLPAAFVAQDGLEDLETPWDEFDVLFVGGTTGWKLGPHARRIVAEAKLRGKRVHMGRVNSYRRLSYARLIGCDSADGTFIKAAPDENLVRVASWFTKLDGELDLGTVSS